MVLTEVLEHLGHVQVIFGGKKLTKKFTEKFSTLESLKKVDVDVRSRVVMLVLGVSETKPFEIEELAELELDSNLPKFIFEGKFLGCDLVSAYDVADATEKQLIGSAVLRTSAASDCLAWIMSDRVADCDKPYYLISLAQQSSESRDLVWNYLMSNQQMMMDKYASGVFLLPRLFKGVLERYNRLEAVSEFCESHKIETAKQAIAQGFFFCWR